MTVATQGHVASRKVRSFSLEVPDVQGSGPAGGAAAGIVQGADLAPHTFHCLRRLAGPGLREARSCLQILLQGFWTMNAREAGKWGLLCKERFIRLLCHIRWCSQVELGLHSEGTLWG